MIEAALWITLGFCAGGLLALLVAPSMWKRAVRLTTKRVEATMPMSLSDIEADKDQLRADHAMQTRRLETALDRAKDRSANQLVDISRLQIAIGTQREEVARLETALVERQNAANVFAATIERRLPTMEAEVAALQSQDETRRRELVDLETQLRRRDEQLAQQQRAAAMQQAEIARLREAMEKAGAEHPGRLKLRPSQWTLDDYRAEYDRLNVEQSRLREQLAAANEREAHQTAALRADMQRLAEQMLAAGVPAAGPAATARDDTARGEARAFDISAAPTATAARAPAAAWQAPPAAQRPQPAQSLRARRRDTPGAPPEPLPAEARSVLSDPVLPARATPGDAAPLAGADTGLSPGAVDVAEPPSDASLGDTPDALSPAAATAGGMAGGTPPATDIITDLVKYLQDRDRGATPVAPAAEPDATGAPAFSAETAATDAADGPAMPPPPEPADRDERKRRLLERLRTMNESASG